MTARDHLVERYGAPAPGRRRVLLAGLAVLVLAASALLTWIVVGQASPSISSRLVGFDVVDDRTVQVSVQIEVSDELAQDLRDGTAEASCTLRAGAEDHRVVGELVFTPSPTSGRIEQTIRTERRATSAESIGCTADGQLRPR